jgi:hypothetical protein
MNEHRLTRNYSFHGLHLRVLCSAAIAESLDNRFRLLPSDASREGSVYFDFQSVANEKQHRTERPLEQGRPFYEFPEGEAFYFGSLDQLYVSFRNGVRALCTPSRGCASFSIIETDPGNLFMASHLILTILLVEILKRRGSYSVHAAGFSKDRKAILIPGTSGAGKSTLAITLLRSGFGYLSDDMVFVRRQPGELRVLGFPEDVDVSDGTISFFPELDFLRHCSKAAGSRKRQVRADEVYRAELVSEARPGAIVFPQISENERSVLRPIGADEAFLELASNVLLTEARSCQEHLRILSELARETPCYRLATGRDFDHIPFLLSELLSCSREEIRA